VVPLRLVVPLLLVLGVLAGLTSGREPGLLPAGPRWEADGARFRTGEALAHAAGVAVIPAPGPLTFAPGTAPADQAAVLDAVAAARPEAQQLIGRVAGLTTVRVTPTGPGIAGTTQATEHGWDVELDLAPTARRFGPRGTARLVLHELGHVVDHALVTTDLEQRLDAATPVGVACVDEGLGGACAAREERFAESFAKWAANDMGLNIELGYRVPPPDLATWGRPLEVLLG
jgi:hypothetical protein